MITIRRLAAGLALMMLVTLAIHTPAFAQDPSENTPASAQDYSKTLEKITIGLNADQYVEHGNRRFEFAVKPMTVKQGQSAKKLLESAGIVYDPSSLSVLYSLNPDINRIDDVEPGTQLTLPHVLAGNGGGARRGNNKNNVYLTFGKQATGYSDKLGDLKDTTLNYSMLSMDRFQDASARDQLTRGLMNGLGSLSILRSDKNAVPISLIEQTMKEAEIVNSFLSAAVASDKKLGDIEIQFANKMTEQWEIPAKEVAEGYRGTRRVRVETYAAIAGAPNQEQDDYIVHWIAEGIYDIYKNDPQTLDAKSEVFNDPSSPTDERDIKSGDYQFWALYTDPDSPTRSAYQRKQIRSRTGGPLSLPLFVPKKSP